MVKTKCIFIFVILFYVHGSTSKPTEGEITQGRGIGSTIWEWITYPFSWWSSKEDDPKPVNDLLIASTTLGPYDNIEIGKHNVTVWCNDQTCTTMKCNKDGCRNNTCNIYDTNTMGECREYTTIVDPEEPPQITSSSKPQQSIAPTDAPIKIPDVVSTETSEPLSIPIVLPDSNNPEQERPLELEVLMSSTVDKTTEKN